MSVVVPVYNGRQTIAETVKCILGQSLTPHETIVVDDGSTDDTLNVLKQFGDRITVLSKPNGGPASARNWGIRAATGEFVAFTDGDCLPHREWLANLIRGFKIANVGGVGGTIRRADEGLVSEYVDLIRLFDPARDKAGQISWLATGNACFRREVLVEAGMFDERFRKPAGEEPELCWRILKLGYRFEFADEAIVLHHHKQTVKTLLKTLATYGEASYLMQKIWPEVKSYDNARADLIRWTVLPLRFVPLKIVWYSKRHGVRRGVLFTFLDHFRTPAAAWGYIKAMKEDGCEVQRKVG